MEHFNFSYIILGIPFLIGTFLVIRALIFLIKLPITVAKSRDITGSKLKNISILTWGSLLMRIFARVFGISYIVTWVIAFVLAITYKPKK